MSLTIVTATDAILGRLKTQWDADTPTLNDGDIPPLVYEATERSLEVHPKDKDEVWARVTIRHSPNQGPAAIGKRRFRRTGTVFVQVYVPNKDGTGSGYTLAQQFGAVAQNAFDGKRCGGVSIKQCAVMEKGTDGRWYRADCNVSFWWDEIRTGS